MYQCGPYTPNHATAATFAFRRELLKQTKYDDNACLAEEKDFLKGYTIPFVQLDSMKTILVFSHIHNSFDKKKLLENPNRFVKLSNKTVDDFVKEPDIKTFFMETIDDLLKLYNPGMPQHKPDVMKQMDEMQKAREQRILEYQKQQERSDHKIYEKQITEQSVLIQELMMENQLLKDKVFYYEGKIKQLIQNQIKERKDIK